ncbi:MAG: ABC transporter permease [Rhodospirillales bacterium]|nr:ABC transporter permease [Rhodospirillales bacterium]
MRALNRKLLRDLWKIKTQVLAIAVVVGCGVAIIVMALGTMRSLEETRAAYYERYRFADVFAHVKRAPEYLAERVARIPGVKWVESRVVADVTLDVPGMAEPATGRLVSIPEHGRPALNDIKLRRGRALAPDRPDEVLIDETFAEAHGFRPGDHFFAMINDKKRKLRIVGVALSPEYIYSVGPGVLVPDKRRFGVMWISREALASAFDLEGAFNDISLSLLPSASSAEIIERLDDLLDPYGNTGAYDRDDQVSHAYLSGEMDQLVAVATVAPPIFLGVAAFLLHIVITRLVATEREQIGLLKSFGYGNAAVGWHYLKVVLVVAGLGVVLGFAGGAYLGRVMTELYTEFFRFPFLYYRLSPDVFAMAALVTLSAAVLGTINAVWRAVRLPPAEAMVPAPPAVYRRTAIERLEPRGLVGQPTRMVFRHIVRWPLRAAMTTLGISLAVAILVSSLFFYDAIEHLVQVYFHHAQRQDVTVTFTEPSAERIVHEIGRLPGVLAVEPYRAVPVRLRFGHRSERVAITGLEPGAALHRVLDARLRPAAIPPDGIVLSTKLAELLAAAPGDVLTVEVLEGRRPVRQVPVAALVEEYIATPAYMDRHAVNRLMSEGPVLSGAYLQVDAREAEALYRTLKDTPVVAGVGLQTVMLRTFRETMAETMDIMISFYVAFGGLIALGVMYNSARIALSEHGRELATLRVLGFTRFEALYILLGELGVLTLLALPLGCLIGYGLAWFFAWSFDTELFRIPLVIERATYGAAVLVVLVAGAASALIVRRRVDRLNLVAVLKTRE